MLGCPGAAMLLRRINIQTVNVLAIVDVHVKVVMIYRMLLESSTTGYQDADVTFCVVVFNSISIEIQELWKESQLVLTLGYPGAAMLLRSINKHFRRVFPGVNVTKDNNASICRMPKGGLATEYQDADPFCVVVDGIGNCKRSSRRILGVQIPEWTAFFILGRQAGPLRKSGNPMDARGRLSFFASVEMDL